MCSICQSEHPDGCCALQVLWRLAHGGEVLPNPLEMGVRPIPSKPVDFVHLKPVDTQEARQLGKSVDEKLEKYRDREDK